MTALLYYSRIAAVRLGLAVVEGFKVFLII